MKLRKRLKNLPLVFIFLNTSGQISAENCINITANNVHLKGGAIASTNPANSELTTNKLTFEDIQNSSSYSATSGAISGGDSQSGSTSVNPSLPMHEQGEDSTVTKATLTEGKITLNKDSQPTETTAKALGINTDISQANKQVKQPKDVNQLLKEQKEISANMGHIATAASNFSNQQAKGLEEEAKEAEKAGDYQTAKAKREEAKSWETGGKNKRKVDAITTALSLALAGQSPQAIATGAASPYINQAIKNITEEIPELNIPAHILWGAIEAELTGGKATTGAIAGGVGELATPILSQALYGNKKTNELTDAEKQQVLNLSKLVAGIASGLTATGNSAENIATISQGMKIAENAVENNALTNKYSYKLLDDKEKALFDKLKANGVKDVDQFEVAFNQAKTQEERDRIIAEYKEAVADANQIIANLYKQRVFTDEDYRLYISSYSQKMLEGAKQGQIENNGKSQLSFWGRLSESDPYVFYGTEWFVGSQINNEQLKSVRNQYWDKQVEKGVITPTEREQILAKDLAYAAYIPEAQPDAVKNFVNALLSDDISTLQLLTKKNTVTKAVDKDLQTLCTTACFVAGTLVETARGLIPIEQIGFGDLIWSREEFGNHYAYKPVTATKVTDNQKLVEVIVENEQGQQETYLTTTEHPFYVEGIGWLKATLLSSEMKLLDRNGSTSLKVVSQNVLERHATIYNIVVDDHHTYHISEFGVWVHNDKCCELNPNVTDIKSSVTNNGRIHMDGNSLKQKVNSIGYNLSAKNQLNLTALAVGFDEKMGGGNHYRNEKVQEVAVSHIKGAGNVVLKGKTIHSEGAEVEAKARLVAFAENELVLDTATQTGTYEEYHKDKKKSLVGSSSKENFKQADKQQAKVSQWKGKEVYLKSEGKATLTGAEVLSQENLVINAKQGVLLDNAENQLTQHQWEKQKKAGFMVEKSGGSMRVGVGANRAKGKDDHQSSQVVSTQLQSLSGNVTVVSEAGDVIGNAVILEAGNDIYLQGKNVALKAANESQLNQHQSSLKSAGMGIGVTYNPKASFKQAYGEQAGQGSAGSLVGKAVTAGEALDKTSHKITQQFTPYVSAKASKSARHEQQSNAVVSQANAGGTLTIIATEGNLSTEGALLSAKGDGILWAKQDVDLGVASSSQSQSAKSTRTGIDFDASRRPTDVVGKYLGKERGQGESETQHASVLSFGGKSHITAKEGNLTLLGTQLVSNDKVRLSAGGNVRLGTAVDSLDQGELSTFHGEGEAVVSETERFSGYNRKLSSQNGKQETHKGVMIASLDNKVDIYAGKDFHQTSGQILAKNRIDISAENVITDTAYNTAEHNSHQSDLKVGMFARVISPIIDLVNSVEKSIKDKDASDRVKAAQLMGLAAQGYNLNHALNHDDKAVLFRAEMGVGLAHSRQRQVGEQLESLGNLLNAKEIHVEARSGKLIATQTDFTSRDENGKRLADSQITLSAKQGIDLNAGESRYKQVGKNQSYGTEVGTAFSVGAKTGWSFYAKEGFSKGKQESEGNTYQNSHLDAQTINIKSGGDVNLNGTKATANSINADIKGNLNITSVQDEHKQKSNQIGLGTKVEFGFGSAWEFSGNASAEGGKSNAKQVNEQSGLFAEEGGYHITADNVHLKGGAIASTNAEDSELTTNKLTFEDIQNSSGYGATSGAISGGDSQSGSTSVNPSLPMYEQGQDSSVTKATLTEGKITLNKDSQPTETTAAALGINTDISQVNKQVKQPKDVNQLLKEQNIIRENVGHIATAASNFSNQQAKGLEEEAKEAEKTGDHQTAKAKREEAKSWETGGENKRKVEAITSALSLALAGQSPQAIATGAASPYINQAIKNITKEIPELNIPAHILWGAIEAELTGGKAATGAIVAGVGELAAPILSQALYGNKELNELTDAEKQQVLNLSKLVAGIASGLTATGNSAENLVTISQGMKIADNAVENNALNASQSVDYLKELSDAIAQGKSLDEINEKYKSISQAEFEKDLQACNQQGLMCYVGTLMAMDAGIKSAEGYKNFYPLPPDIQAQALDFVRNEAARHSIELVDGSPTMIQLALMAIEVGQEMYEAKNAGRSFAADRAQANFAKKVKYSAPIAKPTAKVVSEKNIKTLDGRVLSYSSNIKHVNGKDPNAGLEPNNVIELFKNSVPSTKYDAKKDVRYSVDSKGNIHRFFGDKNTLEFHWSGSTNDISNPLNENHIPNEVKKKLRGSK